MRCALVSDLGMRVRSQFLGGVEFGGEFFADDAAKGVLDLRSFAFDILAEGGVDEGLVASFAAGSISQTADGAKKILVEAYCNFHLSLFNRRFGHHATAFSFAEIVLVFHLCSSYCWRSCGS